MSFKQEVIDAIEVYRKNTAHILGENNEIVKAIENCKKLVEEINDQVALNEIAEELKGKETIGILSYSVGFDGGVNVNHLITGDLVRCEHCMYREERGCELWCSHITGEEIRVKSTDFCSWAEKGEG